MTNEPKTINKYEQSKLIDRHDMEQSECRDDDNTGCPYYSDNSEASIKSQAEPASCTNNSCKK